MTRLDQFLAARHPEVSRSQITKALRTRGAEVDGTHTTTPSLLIHGTETVAFSPPIWDGNLTPSELPIPILAEGTDWLVVAKPVNLVTHPTTPDESDSAIQRILANRPEIGSVRLYPESRISQLRPGIVHRLDRDTEGLLVVAKTMKGLTELSKQFHDRIPDKTYTAVVWGALRDTQEVTAPIHRVSGARSNLLRASHDPSVGREAHTTFTPAEVFVPYPKWPNERATRVTATLHTGRTHQARIHAKFIGHPILGDPRYTHGPAKKLSQRLGLSRQLLAATSLRFVDPENNEPVEVTYTPDWSAELVHSQPETLG